MSFNILLYILITLVLVLIILLLKKKPKVIPNPPPPLPNNHGRDSSRYVVVQYSSDSNTITYSDCLKSGLHAIHIVSAKVTQIYVTEYIKACNNAWYQHGIAIKNGDN